MELFYFLCIFSIPVYFICRWVMYKNKIGKTGIRWCLAFIPTVFLTPVILFFLAVGIIFILSYTPSRKFNKDKWNTNIEKRYIYSNSLINKKTLIGKNTDEVVDLLGNKEQYVIQNDSVHQITYYLGVRYGLMTVNCFYLDISIVNDKVIDVQKTHDNGNKREIFREEFLKDTFTPEGNNEGDI